MRATTMWATTWNSNRRTQRHSMQLAKILIPIYRDRLSDTEEASLRQTHRILGHYPIEVILPEAVTPPEAVASLGLPVRRVSDEWLGTRNGIAGYNRMMLSQSFYDYYSDTMYVLVCHTDAWVFRDELADWCRKGYDCVAAPWVRRPVYDKPIVKQYMNWLANRRIRQGRFCRQQLYGRVGNGGFSLRRVEAFSAACDRYGANIKRYLSNSGHQWNEDVFWATVPQEFTDSLQPFSRCAVRVVADLPQHSQVCLPVRLPGLDVCRTVRHHNHRQTETKQQGKPSSSRLASPVRYHCPGPPSAGSWPADKGLHGHVVDARRHGNDFYVRTTIIDGVLIDLYQRLRHIDTLQVRAIFYGVGRNALCSL